MESAQKLFAKMYEAQNPQGGAGQAGPGPDMGGNEKNHLVKQFV